MEREIKMTNNQKLSRCKILSKEIGKNQTTNEKIVLLTVLVQDKTSEVNNKELKFSFQRFELFQHYEKSIEVINNDSFIFLPVLDENGMVILNKINWIQK